MNIITINVGQSACGAAPLLIGYAGDDSVDEVDFDFSAWAQGYGEGTISLELMRASDTAPYPAILTVDGTTARWTVSDVDTARSGPGVAQLIYKPALGTKKSAIYKFYVGRSLTEPGADDPWGPIIERMEEILAEMQQQAAAADQSAEAASGSAQDAEAWAVGERGGEPVPVTDETHENNAKYYAEQAKEVADSIPESYEDFTRDVVLVQEEQPTAKDNRLWVLLDDGGEVEVPTYQEHTELASANNNLTDCARLGLIPYACNGNSETILSVVQNGNEVTVNGKSETTVGQAAVKILLVDHIEQWKASSAPTSAHVYPLYLIDGHTYKLKTSVVGGNRDAGTGTGKLVTDILKSDNSYAVSSIIGINETENEVLYESSGEYVQIRLRVVREMTATNLVVRIELSDVTAIYESRPWCYGKKINWLGDSIVAGDDFDEIVSKRLNMLETDYGIGGSTIALAADGSNPRNACCVRYADMTGDCDIVAVSCGSNDWMYAICPVGDINSADDGSKNDTFYGALKTLCKGLIVKYPQKKIFFTTPIKRAQAFQDGNGGTFTPDGVMTTPFSKNKYGKTLLDYCDIIKEVCGYYSIPVLDMNRECLLNPSIPEQQNLFDSVYTHPNNVGRGIMADRVCGWLADLFRK